MIFFKKKKNLEPKPPKPDPLAVSSPQRILTARGWMKKVALAKEQKLKNR